MTCMYAQRTIYPALVCGTQMIFIFVTTCQARAVEPIWLGLSLINATLFVTYFRRPLSDPTKHIRKAYRVSTAHEKQYRFYHLSNRLSINSYMHLRLILLRVFRARWEVRSI
jgi:hypothetical protein